MNINECLSEWWGERRILNGEEMSPRKETIEAWYHQQKKIELLKLDLEKVKKERDELVEALEIIELHACLTGDCPHWKKEDCYSAIPEIRQHIIATLKEREGGE